MFRNHGLRELGRCHRSSEREPAVLIAKLANGNSLIDGCEQVASPALRITAAEKPIGYAASEALLRLSEVLASPSVCEGHSQPEKQIPPAISE